MTATRDPVAPPVTPAPDTAAALQTLQTALREQHAINALLLRELYLVEETTEAFGAWAARKAERLRAKVREQSR
jgi:hypothetical protein